MSSTQSLPKMMRIYKVWSGDRKQKKSVKAESLEDLKQKGCVKLGITTRKYKIVDESDGTEIDDDEFLEEIQSRHQAVMILRSSEDWKPRDADVNQLTTASLDDDDSETDDAVVDKNCFNWSTHSTTDLIATVERRFSELNSPSSVKKKVWDKIGADMLEANHKVTGQQCDSKWKGLKLTYCRSKKENMNWPFFESMNRILGEVPNPAQTTTSASAGIKHSAAPQPSCSTTDGSPPAKKKKVAAETEEDKQLRENQERKTTLLSILGQLTQLIENW